MWKPSDRQVVILSVLFLTSLISIYLFEATNIFGWGKIVSAIFSCLFILMAALLLGAFTKGFFIRQAAAPLRDVLDADFAKEESPQPVFKEWKIWALWAIIFVNVGLFLLLFFPLLNNTLRIVLSVMLHLISSGGLWVMAVEE